MCMARRQTSTQGLFFERVCTHPRLAWRSSPPPRLEGVALGPRRRALRALADDLPAGAQAVRRGVASLLPERHRRRSCDHLRWPPAATRIVACLLGGGARARAREAPGPAGRAPLRAQGGDRVRQPPAPPHVEVRVGARALERLRRGARRAQHARQGDGPTGFVSTSSSRRWRRRASTRSRTRAGAAKIRGPGCGSSAHTGRAASVPSPARKSGGRLPPPPRCRRRRGSHRTNQCRARGRASS